MLGHFFHYITSNESTSNFRLRRKLDIEKENSITNEPFMESL